jgi:hypothetical protein
MKLKTHEFCRVIVISYIEIVINSRERFEQVDTYTLYKQEHLTRSFRKFELISLGLVSL